MGAQDFVWTTAKSTVSLGRMPTYFTEQMIPWILWQVHSGSVLSILLVHGYWQVEMHPEDKEKTAFSTQQGLFELNVKPFGLCNGPATFQRLMDMILSGLQCLGVHS